METRSLKRVLDFKLVYDCLAESSSGRVRLDALVSHWPPDLLSLSKLPRDCETFWRQSATEEGLVDWDGFSGGLEKALKADEERLGRGEPPSQAEQSLRSLQTAAHRPVAQVTSGEIERFLSSCQAGSLVKALARAGRDMHRWQVSIHKQNAAAAKKGPADSKPGPAPAAEKGRKEKRRSSSLSAGREKEELVRGVEVLESTQRWFQSRLAVLSLEDRQRAAGSEQLRAEDLLAELEGEEDESQTLQHLRVINSHLSSLALTADSQPPLPSPSLVPSEQPSRPAHPIAVVEFPIRKTRPLRSVPNMAASRTVPLGLRSGVHRSVSVPTDHRQRAATLESSNHASLLPPAPRRKPHRSSSFNDKNKGALGGKPVRAASSMSTLVQQYTDYPGHHTQPSPLLPRPIRHSSSVQSLPVYHQSRPAYPPPPKNAPPPSPFSLPPSRFHSTQSLTQVSHRASSGVPSHQFVSEVL